MTSTLKHDIAGQENFHHFEVIENAGPFIALLTTRRGGISRPPFDSLNMSFDVGDERTFVEENRWRLANHLNTDVEKLIALNQIHSDIIYEDTTPENSGMPGDGHFIREPGYYPIVSVADCVPLFLADPVRKVIGVIHAGWRGLYERIVSKAILKMVESYRSDPNNIIAVIGPSIGPCHYEVQKDLIDQFEALLKFECIFYEQIGERYYLNLWTIAHFQLITENLYPGHIFIEHACTACQTEHYFSHRASGGKTGRMWAVVGIHDPEKS